MTAAEVFLLREAIERKNTVRPRGDAVVANSLQGAGLVTVHWIGGNEFRVAPTERGRKCLALMNARRVA